MYLQINKFNPMGDVIGSGMGEFFKSTPLIDVFILYVRGQCVSLKLLNVHSQV